LFEEVVGRRDDFRRLSRELRKPMKQRKRRTNVSSHDRRRESRSLKKRLNARLYGKLNEYRK
jgi:hypothetical protein